MTQLEREWGSVLKVASSRDEAWVLTGGSDPRVCRLSFTRYMSRYSVPFETVRAEVKGLYDKTKKVKQFLDRSLGGDANEISFPEIHAFEISGSNPLKIEVSMTETVIYVKSVDNMPKGLWGYLEDVLKKFGFDVTVD